MIYPIFSVKQLCKIHCFHIDQSENEEWSLSKSKF
uniref:Uncharacterized protein n=1 Tax=Arundo donax TaxID=35708 RepID=A0A0A8Z9P4_ARUDO